MKSNMKSIKSISKFLFSDSLEAHMKKYMQDVKLTELNQQYQLAECEVVREAERYNLSQVETMAKLEQLKEDFKKKITESLIIDKSKSDSPEPAKSPKEEYKPMTASEYENKINKKPTYRVKNRRELINELEKKLKDAKNMKDETINMGENDINIKNKKRGRPKGSTKPKKLYSEVVKENSNIENLYDKRTGTYKTERKRGGDGKFIKK